ncbi:MAG: NAD-dependent epimerase/dehydratase family protein, partial [Omnitrophica WOR_2 bacterium]
FTYVDDCVDGICKGIDLLVNKKESNQTINLAFGQGNTLVTMAQYIGDALGKQPNMKFKPARVGEVTHYVANIGKARALLGYNPSTSLKEGIFKAVEWSSGWGAIINPSEE